jgi:hypothetical protein
MDILWKLMSFVFLCLFLVSSCRVAITFRRRRQLRANNLLLTGMLAVLSFGVYVWMSGMSVQWTGAVAAGLGLLVGWIWAMSVQLSAGQSGVTGKGTAAGFIIWVLLMAGVQLSNLILSHSPPVLVVLLSLQTGVLTAYNCALAGRCTRFEKEVARDAA